MFGGPGDDVYNGGSGSFDFASLVLSPAGVIVDLNLATPQNTNEGIDTFLGIEGVEGTELNDVLIGQNVPSETGNGLFGLGGTDQLLGMDGNDVIVGDAGDDRGGVGIGQLNGGLGNDAISGGPGNDDLLGEAGNDVLFGGESEETTGDFGSGGPDIDDCTEIETPDPDPANACEKLAPRIATSRPAGWRTVLSLRRSR